ncbi:MAG: DUF4142 domain-containing protein [Flavobacteriales bacterium]|nr:MAG: DUF4142 domain-containing protein [Flavobacteriales bacterium]
MRKILILIGCASVVIGACTQGPSPSSQNDTTQIAKTPIDSTLSVNEASNTFANLAAIGGMMEVETGALMIKYTENRDVQNLATIMIKDHGAANAELKAIAKVAKLGLPQVLPTEKLKTIDTLNKLMEDERNRFYANLMVKEHQKAVAIFSKAAADEQDTKLKGFAIKHLPKLKHHLLEAERVHDIMEKIKGDKGDYPLKTSQKAQ